MSAQTLQLQRYQQRQDAITCCSRWQQSCSYASTLALLHVFGHSTAQDIKAVSCCCRPPDIRGSSCRLQCSYSSLVVPWCTPLVPSTQVATTLRVPNTLHPVLSTQTPQPVYELHTSGLWHHSKLMRQVYPTCAINPGTQAAYVLTATNLHSQSRQHNLHMHDI